MKDKEKNHLSLEDKIFLSIVQKGVHLLDQHHGMSLPFRESDPKLPNNKSMWLTGPDFLWNSKVSASLSDNRVTT